MTMYVFYDSLCVCVWLCNYVCVCACVWLHICANSLKYRKEFPAVEKLDGNIVLTLDMGHKILLLLLKITHKLLYKGFDIGIITHNSTNTLISISINGTWPASITDKSIRCKRMLTNICCAMLCWIITIHTPHMLLHCCAALCGQSMFHDHLFCTVLYNFVWGIHYGGKVLVRLGKTWVKQMARLKKDRQLS